jgi:hypothetical protein
MVKIRFYLSFWSIKIHDGEHFLYSTNNYSLKHIITYIKCYNISSQEYHEKVKRARERLYSTFGDCKF